MTIRDPVPSSFYQTFSGSNRTPFCLCFSFLSNLPTTHCQTLIKIIQVLDMQGMTLIQAFPKGSRLTCCNCGRTPGLSLVCGLGRTELRLYPATSQLVPLFSISSNPPYFRFILFFFIFCRRRGLESIITKHQVPK